MVRVTNLWKGWWLQCTCDVLSIETVLKWYVYVPTRPGDIPEDIIHAADVADTQHWLHVYLNC